MGRYSYSQWDGTQTGFELDADDVLGEVTDDLLYHGDLNAALRRLMQQGFTDRNGEEVQGWVFKPAGYVEGQTYPVVQLIHGGPKSPWTDGYVFSLSGPIYAGTNEIQRNIVAERILGLPKEPRR